MEIPLPVGASNVKLVKDEYEYDLDIETLGFTREGEDGDIIILPIFAGTEFQEEYLDGVWNKGWTTGMDADQAFTAIINTTNAQLYLQGEADVAGTLGYGWVTGLNPIPLLDETEITATLQVPVDDTGGTASRDIYFRFYLNEWRNEGNPVSDPNYLYVGITVDENGLLLQLYKEIDGVQTKIGDGYDYQLSGSRSTGDLEAIIIRMVIHGKAGTEGAHIHIYVKQSDTIANAESATENQFTGSPFDISDLLFQVAFPSFLIMSQNTSYFDSGSEAKASYLRVDYPDFQVKYETPDANLLKNTCEIWDGNPASGGIKVYDTDHVFENDERYFSNGLIRIFYDHLANQGLNLEWFDPDTDAWLATPKNRMYAYESGAMYNPVLQEIEFLSSEKIIVRIREYTGTSIDDSLFLEARYTLRKGMYFVEKEIIEFYPLQTTPHFFTPATAPRFGYVGNEKFSDDDTDVNITNNSPTDNFMLSFDDEADKKILITACVIEPSAYFWADASNNHGFVNIPNERLPFSIFFGIVPFEEIDALFEEAESVTLGGGATSTADVDASDGNAALLDAMNETATWLQNPCTLPKGRYMMVVRAKDTNQIATDLELFAYSQTNSLYMNETQAIVTYTLTADYEFYFYVFDVTEDDVGGNYWFCRARKNHADANEIYVDYFAIVPLGNGESYPQDIAHNCLRVAHLDKRVDEV